MTILSGQTIRRRGIVHPCHDRTTRLGMTFGLGPAGYDLTLDLGETRLTYDLEPGEFLLAAAKEYFIMPRDVQGVVHDKSTWARRGLGAFNTIIDPGFEGYLTLELVNNSSQRIALLDMIPIVQVVFHLLDEPAERAYDGKYQFQEAGPQPAR